MEAVGISSRKKYVENYSVHGPKVTALVQLLGNAPDLSAHVVLVGNVIIHVYKRAGKKGPSVCHNRSEILR